MDRTVSTLANENLSAASAKLFARLYKILLLIVVSNHAPLVQTSRSLVLRTVLDGLTGVRFDE
jgi:hypothetical protein